MRDNSRTAPTTDTLLERAREIARLAAEQAPAIEQQRRLPDELMQALKDSALLRVLQPAHWGGYERDLRTFLRVATEIAKAIPQPAGCTVFSASTTSGSAMLNRNCKRNSGGKIRAC